MKSAFKRIAVLIGIFAMICGILPMPFGVFNTGVLTLILFGLALCALAVLMHFPLWKARRGFTAAYHLARRARRRYARPVGGAGCVWPCLSFLRPLCLPALFCPC